MNIHIYKNMNIHSLNKRSSYDRVSCLAIRAVTTTRYTVCIKKSNT